MRSRTPASTASTTCRPSCCATSSGSRSSSSDRRVAIAVDVRSAASLPHLLPLLAQLKDEGVAVHPIFLDATTAALVRRFSETRRAHPLADRGALVEAIDLERELLAGLREVSTVLDTSQLRPTQLRSWMRELVGAPDSRLTLVFESFAYRHGVPLDADYVFDVRVAAESALRAASCGR